MIYMSDNTDDKLGIKLIMLWIIAAMMIGFFFGNLMHDQFFHPIEQAQRRSDVSISDGISR